MQRLALLCVLVPAGAVLSGTPVTNPTIRNAVASLATLTPGGKWKTSCTGAFVDLDGLGNVWRNGTWWFATAAHCLADEDKNVDLSTLPNMALDAAEKPIHDSMHSAAPPLLRDRPRLSLCNLNSTIQHMVRDHDAV